MQIAKYTQYGMLRYFMISQMQSSFSFSSIAEKNISSRFSDAIQDQSEYHVCRNVTLSIDEPLINTWNACSKDLNSMVPLIPLSDGSLGHHFSRPLFKSSSYNMGALSSYKINNQK